MPANSSPAAPTHRCTFLEGPAGSGKTTAGVARLLALLESGVPASSILVMTPQRTLATPYLEALQQPDAPPGPPVILLTAGGLARRSIDLFWPVIAAAAGFAHPNQPPAFLTLETAQYYMAHLVRPLLEEGYFDSVVIDRNRLYSQVLDNLNKAALVGFPHTEFGDRLKTAWVGETSQIHIYEDAQECANRFRQYCLEHNLLDFSLQVEVFNRHLWPSFLFQSYLKNSFRHLIADNLEEDTPFTHDLLRRWLPDFDSALLIYDQDAGYRRFLAADPNSALTLAELCDEHLQLDHSYVAPAPLLAFANRLGQVLERQLPSVPGPASPAPNQAGSPIPSLRDHLDFTEQTLRFYPQMLDWVTARVAALVEAGTPPGEIAILAPFLPDALRFSLTNRLESAGIPYRSHRPSRSLRDEPATHCLLTLASLAHPTWGLVPSKFDLAYALIQSIDGLDLVRAQLLVEIVYRHSKDTPHLTSFEQIKPDMQARITYTLGGRYEALRAWLAGYTANPAAELDFFLSRLFGEVLSQPGFGFHTNLDAGRVAANLIESVQKFRWAVGPGLVEEGVPFGKEYILMVQDGVIAAQYVQEYQQTSDAVLIAPAYTFLMNNRPVDIQFWLDVGSQAWSERLYQPLTQPYVLSRQWPAGRTWTDLDEYETSRENLYRLALGLVRRCRSKVYLALSELSEQGYETRSLLLKATQRILMESQDQAGMP
jgi:hypothetical protein